MTYGLAKWLRRNASTLLSCLAAGGLVVTAALAVRATPAAKEAYEQARAERDGEAPTGLETACAVAKEYLPALAAGAGTMICIFSANALNRRQQAALTSAYAALESAWQGYRGKVRQIMGPGADHMVERAMEQERQEREEGDRPPWDAVQTFYLEGCETPRFFESTMEQVVRAEYALNRYFVLSGEATFNHFLTLLGQEPTPEGETIGWNDYIGEAHYGYRWIDFDHRYFETDDGLMVCSIDMPFDPHPLDEEEDDRRLLEGLPSA